MTIQRRIVIDIRKYTIRYNNEIRFIQMGTCSDGSSRAILWANDHHFGGFDEGGDSFAGFEAHFAHCVGGDDGSDALFADGECHLSEKAANPDAENAADKLIASADVFQAFAPDELALAQLALEKTVQFRFGDAMVAAFRFDGAEFSPVDPLLDGWIADAEDLSRLTG